MRIGFNNLYFKKEVQQWSIGFNNKMDEAIRSLENQIEGRDDSNVNCEENKVLAQ